MIRSAAERVASWDDLLDRDIERLLDGQSPDNRDLAQLQSLVSALATFRVTSISEDLIADFSKRAGEIVRESGPAAPPEKTRTRGRHFILGLRRRAMAGLTSLMMVSAVTGVAWASDGAVPGDWNYGIDRALEAVGIGNGGAEERLQELAQLREGEPPGAAVAEANRFGPNDSPPGQNDSPPTSPPPEIANGPGTGLETAAAAVVEQGSENSLSIRTGVSAILLRRLTAAGEIDGATIAEMARNLAGQQGRPETPPANEHANPPDHAGQPDDPGQPDNPGQPDDPGQPDNPGQPADPGKP